MINQVYVEKLVGLIKQFIITINDIKVEEYKTAVINSL